MKSLFIYVLFAGVLAMAKCNQYTLENPTLVTYSPKYMKDPVYTITKTDDDYTIHMEAETLEKLDDKVSITFTLLKKVDNRYEPTELSLKFKLCKFFEDPIGKLLLQQAPSMKCPFLPQKHSFTFKSLPLNQIPFANNLDSSFTSGIRIDIHLETDTKESILKSATEINFL